jgi:hypothetical protein
MNFNQKINDTINEFYMKKIGNWRNLIFIFFLNVFSYNVYAQIDVYDGFEKSRLSKIWSSKRMEASAFETQSNIVYKGNSAAKITLRAGDIAEAGDGKDLPTERDELLEIGSLESIEGVKYEYQFSMFLPDSFPIVPVRLVIAQWKQDCPDNAPCSNYNPILAIRYESGRLFITLKTDSNRHTLYELNQEIRNQWIDFKFQVRFTRQNNGEIIAYMNGKEIVNYKGVTSYPDSRTNPTEKNRYYFKMGLYRDRMKKPMTIFIDDYKKKEMPE